MNGKAFLDTNILVYCYTVTEPDKQKKALYVASQSDTWISTQNLKELINTLRKKFGLDWSQIKKTSEELNRNFPVHINTPQTIDKACEVAEKYGFSFYDSLILAAALEIGCTVLYSEDLQHQQVIENQITIFNPFL